MKKVLAAVGVPLIVYGPGVAEKDNEVLVAVAEAAKGERIALANCEDKNYRTIVAAALANGHLVVARTPIDVNLAKQLNILISDMGLPLDRILMDPTTGALGYGIEYTYSVMERLRIAALMGDGMTQQPLIVTVGEEIVAPEGVQGARGRAGGVGRFRHPRRGLGGHHGGHPAAVRRGHRGAAPPQEPAAGEEDHCRPDGQVNEYQPYIALAGGGMLILLGLVSVWRPRDLLGPGPGAGRGKTGGAAQAADAPPLADRHGGVSHRRAWPLRRSVAGARSLMGW